MGKLELLFIAWWNYKIMQPLWKTILMAPQQVRHRVAI